MHEKRFLLKAKKHPPKCYDSANKGGLDKKQDAYVSSRRLVTCIVGRFKCRPGSCLRRGGTKSYWWFTPMGERFAPRFGCFGLRLFALDVFSCFSFVRGLFCTKKVDIFFWSLCRFLFTAISIKVFESVDVRFAENLSQETLAWQFRQFLNRRR